MEVEGESEKNIFNTLSKEVQNKIFSYVSPNHRQIIRAVCTEWKNMINANYQIGILLNNKTYIWTLNSTNTITAKIPNFTIDFTEPVQFKQTIRNIEFHKIVISYNVIRLLTECHLLENLQFSNLILDSQRKIACPEGLELPNVKCIRLDLKGQIIFTTDELILINFLKQIEFGKLEKIVIHSVQRLLIAMMQFDFILEAGIPMNEIPKVKLPFRIQSSEFLNFMMKNGNSLKQLSTTGHELRLFGSTIEVKDDGTIESIAQIQFEKIKYNFKKLCINSGNEWNLIGCQTHLKNINIQTDVYAWPHVIRAIKTCAGSLMEAKIKFKRRHLFDFGEQRHFQNFDISIFEDCTKLVYLKITCHYIPTINVSTIPTTIETFSIDGPQTKEDLLTIASSLTKLKSFTLLFNDSQDTSVFDAELFQAFVRIVTLEKIVLGNCKIDNVEILKYCVGRDGIAVTYNALAEENGINTGELTCLILGHFDHEKI